MLQRSLPLSMVDVQVIYVLFVQHTLLLRGSEVTNLAHMDLKMEEKDGRFFLVATLRRAKMVKMNEFQFARNRIYGEFALKVLMSLMRGFIKSKAKEDLLFSISKKSGKGTRKLTIKEVGNFHKLIASMRGENPNCTRLILDELVVRCNFNCKVFLQF